MRVNDWDPDDASGLTTAEELTLVWREQCGEIVTWSTAAADDEDGEMGGRP